MAVDITATLNSQRRELLLLVVVGVGGDLEVGWEMRRFKGTGVPQNCARYNATTERTSYVELPHSKNVECLGSDSLHRSITHGTGRCKFAAPAVCVKRQSYLGKDAGDVHDKYNVWGI